jgi:ABC-2 type transport system permease protein
MLWTGQWAKNGFDGISLVVKMSNVLVIAKKEFSDLLGNWMMLVVFTSFLALILADVYSFMSNMNNPHTSIVLQLFRGNFGIATANLIYWDLAQYGAILGVMIGCLSISNERHNRALNTLVVKPVYRDTIINGKLLGSISFLVFIMGFVLVFYSSIMLIFCGNALAPFIGEYISMIGVVFVFSVVFVLFFFSLAMLISLLVRDQAFALILSLIFMFIFGLMQDSVFVIQLSGILPGSFVASLVSLSPNNMFLSLFTEVFGGSISSGNAFALAVPFIVKLLVGSLIACTVSYIVFLRRDIT